ncbi:MAG: GGDEF domain-containing protein [Alphaproteobacteria bacterium]|nr:GGDEF domain-containing protein [Alphaproteobacteria bacterium]
MKIDSSRPVAGVSRGGGRRPEAGRAGAPAPRRIEDSASVMGIPEAEFTPRVREAIVTLMAEVESMRRDLEQAQRRIQELEQIADLDPLVPIHNRRAFVRELDRAISYAERYGGAASLIYMDVNGLKAINDRHGHAAGDEVIRHVAGILTENVRRSDMIGRLGGDEFGILLAQAGREVAAFKAEQLAAAIAARPFVFHGETIPISVSHGCHTLVGGDPARALDAADKEMYARKRAIT